MRDVLQSNTAHPSCLQDSNSTKEKSDWGGKDQFLQGLRSCSCSMLKHKGCQSRPGLGCSSCGQGCRHVGSLCHYLTRHQHWGCAFGLPCSQQKLSNVNLSHCFLQPPPRASDSVPVTRGGFGQGSCAHRNITFSRWQYKQAVTSHWWNSRSDSKVYLILNALGCSVLLAVGLVL